MNFGEFVASDIHTHAERTCKHPHDEIQEDFDQAATIYFKKTAKHPTINKTIAYYRSRQIRFAMFTVDPQAGTGIANISNEKITEAAIPNSEIMVAFASIDLHKGKRDAIKVRRLIQDYGVKGFKLHPPMQNFNPH